MGGGAKSSSKSRTGSAQKWAKPYAKAAAGSVQGVFNQYQPNLDALTGKANEMAGLGMDKFKSGLGNVGLARGFNADVLGGKYLQGNPYLDQMIARSRGDITNQVNSQFSLAGRYGSGAHTDVLADSLADMESGLRYQNYATEMDRMGQAAGMAEGASQADQGAALAPIGLAAEIPYTGANNLANNLGALFNGGKTTEKNKGPGLASQALGAAASIGSAYMMCDVRAKEDISLVAVEGDGLPVYEFSYKPGMGPEGRHRGPMAQDVAALRPWALGPEVGGFMTIIPDKL